MPIFPAEQLFNALSGIISALALLVDSVGDLGMAVVNILLGIFDYQIPDKINLGVMNLNTSVFFNTVVVIIGFYYIAKTAPLFFQQYFKWLIASVVIVVVLSVLSGFLV